MEKLTPTQRLALQRNLNLAVTAGAGTGKTMVLVERYLDLLLREQVDIRDILAITFTNKASAEMMNRVARRLEELSEQKTDPLRRMELLRLRNRLSSAYISTIHAFCLRLLREYPVESGLDPDFSQLNEMQNELLIEQTIRSEIEQLSQEEQNWLDLFRLFGIKSIQELLRAGLVHRYEIRPFLQKFREKSTGELDQELSALFLDRVLTSFKEYPFDQLRDTVEKILHQDTGTPVDNEKAQKVREVLASFYTSTDQQTTFYWTNFFILAKTCTTKDATAYKVLTSLGGNKSWTNQAGVYLKQLSARLVPVARWLKENPMTPPGRIDSYVLKQLPKLYHLYEQVEKKYQARKREHRWVDFEDMQLMVRELVLKNPALRAQIAARFRFILVDEFQDTNLLQWEIITQLGELIQNKFFIVGDPKQSIYGFRNADVRVFNQARRKFAGAVDSADYPGNVVFKESFRFKENLTHFINTCFSRIIQKSASNQWEVEYTPLVTCREDPAGGEIEFGLFGDEEDPDLQSGFIASRIVQLLKETDYTPGDIAILLRTRNHLGILEEKLRRQNIPFKTIGGIGFYQRQEIFDIYHLLRFLLNPYDDMAVIGLLRSPFANISDEGLLYLAVIENGKSYWEKIVHLDQVTSLPEGEREKLDNFKQYAGRWLIRRDRISFSELLREIFQQSAYRPVMRAQLQGEQLVANLDKILTLATDFEKAGFTTINDFTEYLKNLINTQVKEGEASLTLEDRLTVKVMTIHQAKGLEFPVVFLPYLEQRIRAANVNEAYFDEHIGLMSGISTRGLPPDFPIPDSFFLLDLAHHDLRQKELAELKRLFYVGCTRARDHLVLSAAAKKESVSTDTPLFWFLQAMQLQPAEIKDGEIWEWEKCLIRFRRTFQESEVDHISDFSRIFNSLLQLKQEIKGNHVGSGLTPFLKTILDRPKAEIFSATQLMAFRENAPEYFRRYHLGYFEGDYETFRLAASHDDKAMLKGKILHRYLQFDPRPDFDRLLFELEITDENLIRELRQELQELGEKIVHSPFICQVLSAKKYRNEVKVLMQLNSDFLTGTLDKIFQNESGQWEILDYKTNRIGPEQVDSVLEKYRIQIETYALLLAHLYPQQQKYIVNFYFTHLDQYRPIPFKPEEMPGIKQNFIQIIQEIKQRFEPYSNST